MGRYYGSEALRNPKLQKKAIDYALDKLNPMIQNVGSQALNQLSTKIRPNKKYKTDRNDLDGGSKRQSQYDKEVVQLPQSRLRQVVQLISQRQSRSAATVETASGQRLDQVHDKVVQLLQLEQVLIFMKLF